MAYLILVQICRNILSKMFGYHEQNLKYRGQQFVVLFVQSYGLFRHAADVDVISSLRMHELTYEHRNARNIQHDVMCVYNHVQCLGTWSIIVSLRMMMMMIPSASRARSRRCRQVASSSSSGGTHLSV